ncbi:Complement C1s-B subcomponent [Papilio machaon]|uniref:Complement C1s-B subcomponent n=1 Tax=Papilio machaon TaxID=76193 RepID=A0A0N1IA85_PAPMA|nr:Complement C1s-B subcomponent [Papilio machaon]
MFIIRLIEFFGNPDGLSRLKNEMSFESKFKNLNPKIYQVMPLNYILLSVGNSGTICLPIMSDLREMDIAQEFATVAGWGATENRQKSNILLKVHVPIYSETTCKSFYKRSMQSPIFKPDMMMNTICAGDEGLDSCKGDSGGPLMIEAPYNGTYKFVQFGIVSHGFEQCGLNKPVIYTDVRKCMKWILDTIKP